MKDHYKNILLKSIYLFYMTLINKKYNYNIWRIKTLIWKVVLKIQIHSLKITQRIPLTHQNLLKIILMSNLCLKVSNLKIKNQRKMKMKMKVQSLLLLQRKVLNKKVNH